jgi:hypothetical protein
MGFNLKEHKRLMHIHRLLNKQRVQLRMMQIEHITHVTFHTTTSVLSLPFDEEATPLCVTAYYEALVRRRKELKAESRELSKLVEEELESGRLDREFLFEAKRAQGLGLPPIPYPKG